MKDCAFAIFINVTPNTPVKRTRGAEVISRNHESLEEVIRRSQLINIENIENRNYILQINSNCLEIRSDSIHIKFCILIEFK